MPTQSFAKPLMALLLAAALPMAAMAAGKTYRWRDANGRVHYSDVPAPKSEEIQITTASGTQAAKAKEDLEVKESKEQGCQRKREQLATYISASKVSETDSLGNTKTYSEAEKEKLVQRTQAQVREACGQG